MRFYDVIMVLLTIKNEYMANEIMDAHTRGGVNRPYAIYRTYGDDNE